MIEMEPTILFLEDDPNDILLIRRVIKKLDLRANFVFCKDGEEGIQYLKGEGEFSDRNQFCMPELIILDIKLPKISGLEVAEWIKTQDKLKMIPVVMLSSSGQPSDILRAYKNGANSFLVKPVGFNQFIDMLKCIYDYWIVFNRKPKIL